MEVLALFVLTTLAACGLLTVARVPFAIASYRRRPRPKLVPDRDLMLLPRRDGWWVHHRPDQEAFGPYTFRQANALISWMTAGTADHRSREQVLEDAERLV